MSSPWPSCAITIPYVLNGTSGSRNLTISGVTHCHQDFVQHCYFPHFELSWEGSGENQPMPSSPFKAQIGPYWNQYFVKVWYTKGKQAYAPAGHQSKTVYPNNGSLTTINVEDLGGDSDGNDLVLKIELT